MLEAFQHEFSSFITLTYADDRMPEDGSLRPLDLKNWLKRIRRACEPNLLRYFAVGEYGDRTMRPHYHVALFGFMPCLGNTVKVKGACQCRSCCIVRDTWDFGHVLVGELNIQSASYITGYVAKKFTRPDNPALQGRHPEFARMSLKPGIGAGAIPDVASSMMQYRLEEKLQDVPTDLRHGSTKMPLGRYLRRQLRKQVGLDENAPAEVLEALRSGLLPVFEAVEVAFPAAKGDLKRLLVQDTMDKVNEQYARNVSARQKRRRVL